MNNVVNELKKVKVFFWATATDNKPHVRPFSTICEFEGNAYICCGKQKLVFKELENNPYVELSGMYDGGSWIRVSAKVELDERTEAQIKVLSDPTGPAQLYSVNDGRFVVYKLKEVKAFKYNFYAKPEEILEH